MKSQSSNAALEAKNRIQCPFTVRILDEDDTLMSSISHRGKLCLSEAYCPCTENTVAFLGFSLSCTYLKF